MEETIGIDKNQPMVNYWLVCSVGMPAMNQLTLDEFIARKGQSEAARLLGVTPPALSKAVRTGRAVFVTEHEDGSCSAEEIKSFPAPIKTRATQE